MLKTETRLLQPGQRGSVLSFTDSKATFGGRLGALYQYAPDGFAGLVFDWYTEDVTFQAPPMVAPAKFEFTSTEWALGVSGRLSRRRSLGAIEWMELKSKDRRFQGKSEGLHLGR
jgi:hypothetical protein